MFLDRLRKLTEQKFVGRTEVLNLFNGALTVPEPPFAILSVYGQGGVGKSTLLKQFRADAARNNVLALFAGEKQATVPKVQNILAHDS